MNVYAESSAVLCWLLGESRQAEIIDLFENAHIVVTSDLTLIECERCLHRAHARQLITEARATERRSALRSAVHAWDVVSIQGEVVSRARRAFPVEPVRSLDAIHLASALALRAELPELAVLSLDERIRANAIQLGLDVLPV